MKEKKLILIVPLYLSYTLFFKGLCEMMVEANWQVWVFTKLPDDFVFTNQKINFIDFDLPRKFEIRKYIKSSYRFRKLVKTIKPTIVHAHFQSAALVVRLSNIHKKTITLTTSHGLIFNTVKSKIKSKIFKSIEVFIYTGFKKVWVLTKSDENSLKDQLPSIESYPTKGLGCDIDKFDIANFDKTFQLNFRKSLGFTDSDYLFIFVGRMTDFKGIDVVFRAFKKINLKYNSTKLIILGDFDAMHPSGLNELEIIELKSNKDIKHIGFTTEVAKFLSISDTMVFPSNKEGMPVNLMEAICMGVPIITLNSRGCVDIVGNKYGVVLDEKNVNTFLSEMEKFYLNKFSLKKIRENQLNDRYLFDRNKFFQYQINEYENYVSIN